MVRRTTNGQRVWNWIDNICWYDPSYCAMWEGKGASPLGYCMKQHSCDKEASARLFNLFRRHFWGSDFGIIRSRRWRRLAFRNRQKLLFCRFLCFLLNFFLQNRIKIQEVRCLYLSNKKVNPIKIRSRTKKRTTEESFWIEFVIEGAVVLLPLRSNEVRDEVERAVDEAFEANERSCDADERSSDDLNETCTISFIIDRHGSTQNNCIFSAILFTTSRQNLIFSRQIPWENETAKKNVYFGILDSQWKYTYNRHSPQQKTPKSIS